MQLLELTMPLDHQWMPDELFPTATRFMLAPRGDPEKGITVGTESGTSLLPGIVIGFGLPVLMGAFSFTAGGLLDRFPRLRVGFFEVGGSWLPFWPPTRKSVALPL